MAVLLALTAAVAYGTSDFLGGLTSRRASPWAVALVVLATAAAATAVLSIAVPGRPSGVDLGWGALAGLGGGVGTVTLYRGLSLGRMGVVAPVSAVGATLVPVVVGVVAAGDRLSALVWAGVVLALPGIWLVARQPAPEAGSGPGVQAAGVRDGILAGLGFGTLFAALGQIPDDAGLLPLALNHAVAGSLVLALAVSTRADWRPRGRSGLWSVAPGLLGAAATAAFLLASQGGRLSVVAVLASLYPAVTVLLAAALLREPVARSQGMGLVACCAAVVLISAG
ncbi:EamA family transporter [Nocardioides acrostichi]|uniref:EamA family transporter n=1 Tax=Nocardioides acrostichi TaxID=2784339 RepID=A0A930UU88_9ACTN|nr:EamA family transporter [Nocardioides acrostichi]MBF4160948.1 EamA family transporter [Nocardioides acrostichi]